MKSRLLIALIGIAAIAWLAGSLMTRKPAHGPRTEHKGPPHGGLLIDLDSTSLEFLLEPDSKARVYTYGSQNQPSNPGKNAAVLTIQGKNAPSLSVPLESDSQGFVSSAPIVVPEEAKAVLTVVQSGVTNHFRFGLSLTDCPACKRPEYRCACSE